MGASHVLIISGSIIFIVFAALGFGGLDLLIENSLRGIMVLKEGTSVWDLWRTMPLPIYIKFRFFNITNAEGLANGAKAQLQEIGPYTYL
ncbi:unnamed protein product [Allacma fusca]|uniref:Uncharacterized protein n=1 Tax=Allacma fusca TaxID=39272 RepID=A0A8J2PNV3_9HEXA|nr:unnamed protein product [Allacma fusca]